LAECHHGGRAGEKSRMSENQTGCVCVCACACVHHGGRAGEKSCMFEIGGLVRVCMFMFVCVCVCLAGCHHGGGAGENDRLCCVQVN